MFDLLFPKNWSTLKKLIWLKAAALSSAIQKTISGAILSIKDALAMPAQSLVVNIDPVQSGSGDPAPDNVRPISGRTAVNIYHEAEYDAGAVPALSITLPPLNLFNKAGFSSVNGYINSGKIVVAGGRVTVYVPCKANTKYTAQKIRQVANDRFTLGWTEVLPADGVAVSCYVAAANSGTVGSKTSLTITTGATAQYLVCWFTWSASNAEVFAAEKDTLMIEEYSLALPYESYGNGPVYNGELDVVTGQLSIKTARRVLTGQETFGILAAANPNIITCNGFLVGCMNPVGSSIPFADIVMLNSHYKHATSGSVGSNPKNTVYYYGERLCIITDPDDSYTPETYATYAAAQYAADTPITCVYQLATPITLTLTPQEVTMLLGENTLWADTGDISLTYMADGRASDTEALNILLGGAYHNSGAADEATDKEALDILLGGTR